MSFLKQHITPYWWYFEYRIEFNIVLFTYKAFNNLAPQYLTDLLVPYAPSRNLRSSDHGLLNLFHCPKSKI